MTTTMMAIDATITRSTALLPDGDVGALASSATGRRDLHQTLAGKRESREGMRSPCRCGVRSGCLLRCIPVKGATSRGSGNKFS